MSHGRAGHPLVIPHGEMADGVSVSASRTVWVLTGKVTYPLGVFHRPRVAEWQEFPVGGAIRSRVMHRRVRKSSLAGNGDFVIKTPS